MAVSTLGRASQIEHAGSAAASTAHGLFERHSAAIFRYCLSQLRSRPEAEDAVQTTFMYAFRALERGVVPQIEIAWLLKIAQNVCRTIRKSAARRARRELASDPAVLASAAPAPERLETELMGLGKALATLPENQRRAVLLREWQGLSYAEIATTMGLSQAAVEMLLFRARRTLAEALGDQPRSRRRRIAEVLDLGWLGWLKSLGGGISVAKTAAAGAAAVVAVGLTAASGAPGSKGLPTHSERPVVANEPPGAVIGRSGPLNPPPTAVASDAARSTRRAAERPRLGGEATTTPGTTTTSPPAPNPSTAADPGNRSEEGATGTSEDQNTVAVEAPVSTPELPSVSQSELPTPPSVEPPSLPPPELPSVEDVTDALPELPVPPLP